MPFWRKFKYLAPWIRRAAERDMQDELRALEDLAGPRELGNLTLAGEDAREAFSWMWLERLGQDLRYALRDMRAHKSFTLVVVLSLGLGIGANTAIFSFMESILMRALPVSEPEQLVIMKWHGKGYALASSGMSWSTGGTSRDPVTGTLASNFPYPALGVFQRSDDILSSAFCYFASERLSVSTPDATDSVKSHYVSGNYFQGMAVAPAAGRFIQPGDDVAGAAPVAVLSHEFARRRFGNPGAAVAQTIRVNDKPVVVVGVAPAAFFGAEPGSIPDLYFPMHAVSVVERWDSANFADEHFYWIEIMGRLKPDVDFARAQTALAARFRQFAESTATTQRQRDDLPDLRLQPGAAGLDSLRREYSQPVVILMAMVGLILLIACSNVANLLLARAAGRRREIAVRLSIGAGRWRVVRQLLTESVLLASTGGALGLVLAWWGIDVLTALLAGGRDHFTLHAALNWNVLGATMGLSIATGLAFGLVPALQATRIDIVQALKDVRAGHPVSMSTRAGLGSLLVATQIALSLLLLVGAGLFGGTLTKLHAIEIGFNRDHVLLFALRPSAVGYRGAEVNRLFEDVRERLGHLPGVQGVSLSSRPLPMGGGTMYTVSVDGVSQPVLSAGTPAETSAVIAAVGPGFFKTMQIPLVAGREFSQQDRPGAPPVVVVNRQFAKMFGLDNPVGRSINEHGDRYEIVGIVDDALAFSLKEERRPVTYFSYLQAPSAGQMTYELRTAGNPLDEAGAVREMVRQIDTRLAIHDLKTQAAHIDQAISREITLARLGSLLAALALAIACVGLYGTVVFKVERRTTEIGIRMALGSSAWRVLRMVLGEVLVLTTTGLAVGIGFSVLGSRYVKSLLYGIEPGDPGVMGGAVALLLACSLIAAFAPARRASRIDPMTAVRRE